MYQYALRNKAIIRKHPKGVPLCLEEQGKIKERSTTQGMRQPNTGLYDPRFEHDNCGIGA